MTVSDFDCAIVALDALCGQQVYVVAEMNGRPVMIATGELQRFDDESAPYLPPCAGDVVVYALDAQRSSPPVAIPVFADALEMAGTSKVIGGMTDGAPVIALIYSDGFSVRVSRVDHGEV